MFTEKEGRYDKMAPIVRQTPVSVRSKIYHTLYDAQEFCSKQMLANPKVELCAFKGGEWIRIAAEAIEDDRVEARKSMLDAYPNLRASYDENDGNTQVFYLKNAVATISSFTAEPKVIKF